MASALDAVRRQEAIKRGVHLTERETDAYWYAKKVLDAEGGDDPLRLADALVRALDMLVILREENLRQSREIRKMWGAE